MVISIASPVVIAYFFEPAAAAFNADVAELKHIVVFPETGRPTGCPLTAVNANCAIVD